MTDRLSFVPGFTKKAKRKTRRKNRTGKAENSATVTAKEYSVGNSPSGNLVKTEVTHGWVPQGEYVEVAGRIVPGMVYICNSKQKKASDDDFSDSVFCIDISKSAIGQDPKALDFEVIRVSDILSRMGVQFLNYGKMKPQNRGSYLDWLATGKKDRGYDKIYPMMYFAGLEYRILRDNCTETERKQILKEVKRLASIYGGIEGIEHYFPRFFNLTDIVFAESVEDVKFPNVFTRIPLSVQVEVSDRIHEGKNLSGKELFDWFCHDYGYDTYNSYPIRGLKDRFLTKFAEDYPEGLEVRSPGRNFTVNFSTLGLDHLYRREVSFNGRPVLDIGCLEEPLHKTQAVLDGIARDQFRQDVSKGVRNPCDMSLLEFALDKDGIFNGHAPIYFPDLVDWARRISRERTQITAGELIAKLNQGARQPGGTPHVDDMVDALALLGIGMAPHEIMLSDPYFDQDDPVFLYESTNNHRLQLTNFAVFEAMLMKLLAGSYLYPECGFNRNKMRLLFLEHFSKALALKKMERDALMANLDYAMLMNFNTDHVMEILESYEEGFMFDFASTLMELLVELDMGESKALGKMAKLMLKLGFVP